MTRQSNTLVTATLVAAFAAVSIASPAFAQTQDHFGSVLPHYFDGTGEIKWGAWAPPNAATADQGAQARASVRRHVAHAAKRRRGSAGYNQNIKNY
jgi:hypothetical protein